VYTIYVFVAAHFGEYLYTRNYRDGYKVTEAQRHKGQRNKNYRIRITEHAHSWDFKKPINRRATINQRSTIGMNKMGDLLWWGKQIAIGCVAVFFLVTGVNVLVASYSLTNPLEFIMYFFSSSMLILVSIVFLIYPVVRIYGRLWGEAPDEVDDEAHN